MHKKPMNNNGGMHKNNRSRPRKFRPHGGSGGNASGGDDRQRRNASANREKYINMARDALASGDRVQAEYYFQHADHYARLVAEDEAQRPRFQVVQGSGERDQQSPQDLVTASPSGDEQPKDVPPVQVIPYTVPATMNPYGKAASPLPDEQEDQGGPREE